MKYSRPKRKPGISAPTAWLQSEKPESGPRLCPIAGVGASAGGLEAFTRLLNHPSSEYEDTGIGLTIVQRAVEHMHEQLDFESAPGQGSTFWFELPTVPDEPRSARGRKAKRR